MCDFLYIVDEKEEKLMSFFNLISDRMSFQFQFSLHSSR